ncbi:MAG: efflux RND transporter periplasmic adaptor subunit [Burkholderiaceae bacterium]|nr:efflux RND transporter periplasmic adaptor subunit [Burkholderiaceae bacterium]
MRISVVAATLVLSLLSVSCSEKSAQKPAPAGAIKRPPPAVGVVVVARAPVTLSNELAGRLEAVRVAQVRARVPGIVQRRLFTEGSEVKAGDPLFKLDDASYQASLNSALAQVARARANLENARELVDRYRPLVAANVVSKQTNANAVAAFKLAEADVGVANAAVKTARINLGYATVTAPISGRIGRALVTEGALVGQGEATHMAVIQQVDPLYVNFTQSANDMLALRRSFAAGQASAPDAATAATVRVVLEDGSVYSHPGKLLFSDLTVDQSSGQVTLRAELPNPEKLLLPGLFVRVRIEQARLADAALIPQQAVVRSAGGDTVQVVDAQGKVAPRTVKVVSSQGDRWVVTDGLKNGDQVVVDGFQKIRPGITVKPVPWRAAGAAPAGPAAQPPKPTGAAPKPAAAAATAPKR